LSVNNNLEKYNAAASSRAIEDFVINDLSTWYIRRSRDRVGISSLGDDKVAFLNTSYIVLKNLSRLLAPFLPFISETIYKNITGEKSVHLAQYPESDSNLIDPELENQMIEVRKLAEIGHAQRKEAGIKLRQPLSVFEYSAEDQLDLNLESILAEELNVKKIEYKKSAGKDLSGKINPAISDVLKKEGEARELIRQVQQMRKEMGLTLKDSIIILLPENQFNNDWQEYILKQTNAKAFQVSDETSIKLIKNE
jgi:isoleucyl-tRNA synthetase